LKIYGLLEDGIGVYALLLVSARMNFGNLLLRQKKYQQAIAGYLLKKLTG